MPRVINKYSLLREKSTGRVGQIEAFRIDLSPRAVSILVKFEGQNNPVCFTGLHNICDSFEVVRRVNGKIRTWEGDVADIWDGTEDVNSNRFHEKMRTTNGD